MRRDMSLKLKTVKGYLRDIKGKEIITEASVHRLGYTEKVMRRFGNNPRTRRRFVSYGIEAKIIGRKIKVTYWTKSFVGCLEGTLLDDDIIFY
jgi:hypothetical protein